MISLRRAIMVKQVHPERHLAGVYPDRRQRLQAHRDLYSCQFDAEPFIMYRVKKNLVRPSWRTDGQGFVSVTHAPGPTPVRVLLLGDSVTFGLGLSHPHENIAFQLEKALLVHSRVRERGLEIVNASQPGYSLLQQALYSRYFLNRPESPHIVLIWAGFNDIHNAFYSGQFGGPMPLLETFVPAVRRAARFLLKLFPPALLEMIVGAELATRIRSGRRQPGRCFPEDRDLYLSLFSDLKARWARQGTRVLFLLQPYLGSGKRDLVPCEQEILAERRRLIEQQFGLDVFAFYAQAYRLYEGWLKETGCDCLSLADALDGQNDQMFLDRVHLSPRAVEIVAQRIGLAALQAIGSPNSGGDMIGGDSFNRGES